MLYKQQVSFDIFIKKYHFILIIKLKSFILVAKNYVFIHMTIKISYYTNGIFFKHNKRTIIEFKWLNLS